MSRKFGWVALVLGVGLATAGALAAYLSAGGPWAAAGAAIGAATGAFAPSLYEGTRRRGQAREFLRSTFEEVPPMGWARLLDPRHEIVAFIGREAELASLVSWCGNRSSERLRLVTGPGGVGKTRLAVELVRRMSECDWRSARIADGKEGEVISSLHAATREPTLLVVDYAETRVGLKHMLSALAGDEGDGVKVLLLARSSGEWWDQLGVDEPGVWDMVQSAKSAELALSPVIAADLSDADIVACAVASFARELGVPARIVEIYGGSNRGRVLDLHAAALVAVLAKDPKGTVRVDIRTVLDELLRHEMHYWYQTARVNTLTEGANGISSFIVRRIVAASCLLGAATEEEARALLSRVPGLSPSTKVASWLRELYPPSVGEPDWLGYLRPDRLAELHTVRELISSPELARACLTSLDTRQARRAVTLLARASSDDAQAAILLDRILPEVADFIIGMEGPLETLTAIYNAIPHPTVTLASVAEAISRQILVLLPADSRPALRAQWLWNLELRLNGLGRPADALPFSEEAVAIYRDLAAASPDRYRPDLAAMLANLSVTLMDLGRPADAVTAAREAAAIQRELAAAIPGRYRLDLAQALDNYGVALSAVNGPVDALPVTEEAVALYRELAASPNRYGLDLARSLDNLGTRLSELGRPADALAAEQDAVAICREFVAVNPDGNSPELARLLMNLSITLARRARLADALPVAEEAVAIYQKLAAVIPDRYSPRLAESLAHVSSMFMDLGRTADALPFTEEAVALYRELAAASPDQYRPDLATSLDNLGTCLSELGRPADALTAEREAVAILRELAAASPDQYRPDLAGSLVILCIILSELGRPADALPFTEEAVALYRELAAASPDDYRLLLALGVVNLGNRLSELGRLADALPFTEEAFALYRELATASPDQYCLDLGQCLDTMADVLTALGWHAEADDARNEAARFREQ